MVYIRTSTTFTAWWSNRCVMTRWNMKDLTGMLLKSQKELKSDQWDVIEFPAILPSNKPVWPEYWKLDELESVKASLVLVNGMHNGCKTQHLKKVV